MYQIWKQIGQVWPSLPKLGPSLAQAYRSCSKIGQGTLCYDRQGMQRRCAASLWAFLSEAAGPSTRNVGLRGSSRHELLQPSSTAVSTQPLPRRRFGNVSGLRTQGGGPSPKTRVSFGASERIRRTLQLVFQNWSESVNIGDRRVKITQKCSREQVSE